MADSYLLPKILIGLRGSSSLPQKERDDSDHLTAALHWIQHAHNQVNHEGVSKGYDLLRAKWSPAYPETTGYTIPTLLNASMALNETLWKDIAINLADFLLNSANADGAVVHWLDTRSAKPIVFDTGQVIFGWLAAYHASGDEKYLSAAVKAGAWLATIKDASGAWLEGQYLDVPKVIDTRVDWALLELNKIIKQETIHTAVIKNLNWAASMQDELGWFDHCAFRSGDDPITHTLTYTAEGFVECGKILSDENYIHIGEKTLDRLAHLQRDDGSVAATFARGWKPTSQSSCLTGNCQLSRMWLSLYAMKGNSNYLSASRKALDFVLRTQDLDPLKKNHYGAIAGSFPIYGAYERTKYPNWAAKFCTDALLAHHNRALDTPFNFYPG